MAEKDEKFQNNGAFNINDQWVTSVRYEAKSNPTGEIESVDLRFMNNRNQVLAVKAVDRAQAVELLGAKNVETIEQGSAHEVEPVDGFIKGRLAGEMLSFKEAFTPDFEGNVVESGDVPQRTADESIIAAAQAAAARRRQNMQLTRANNDAVAAKDKAGLLPDIDTTPEKPIDPAELQKAIPQSLKKQFNQVNEKFYFKDDTLAFEDKGPLLRARQEHMQVVDALVAIANERGWDKITVKGTATFKQAVWMKANLLGIDVKGYKPTELDKQKLLNQKGNDGQRERAGASPENVIIQGQDKEVQHSLDNTQHTADGPTKYTGESLRRVVGELIGHGKAPYNHDEKNNASYFAIVKTEKGEEKIWGVDLKRAIEDGGLKAGDQVRLDYMGNKPVTVDKKVFDGENKYVRTEKVDTHRNAWEAVKVENLTKAETFRNADPATVVAKHPELLGSVAVVAAAVKFAEKVKPGNPEGAKRIVDSVKKAVEKNIENGENMPAPVIAKAKQKDKMKDQPKQKKIAKERERDL